MLSARCSSEKKRKKEKERDCTTVTGNERNDCLSKKTTTPKEI